MYSYTRDDLKFYSFSHSATDLCAQKVEIFNYFLKIQGAISKTTAPILRLFVLIWMHFSYWIQNGNKNFKFGNILKTLICRMHFIIIIIIGCPSISMKAVLSWISGVSFPPITNKTPTLKFKVAESLCNSSATLWT